MDRHVKTAAIVLRAADYSESSRMLTVFSREMGLISVSARGVRRPKSRMRASAQLFCYSTMELYRGHGDVYTLTDAAVVEAFAGIGADLDRLETASRIAKLLLRVLQPELPDPEALRLLLNSLYYLAAGKRSARHVYTVFLLRLLSIEGFLPEPAVLAQGLHFTPDPHTLQALTCIVCFETEELFRLRLADRVLDEMEGIAEKSEREYL